jgi:hypothetical protein
MDIDLGYDVVENTARAVNVAVPAESTIEWAAFVDGLTNGIMLGSAIEATSDREAGDYDLVEDNLANIEAYALGGAGGAVFTYTLPKVAEYAGVGVPDEFEYGPSETMSFAAGATTGLSMGASATEGFRRVTDLLTPD